MDEKESFFRNYKGCELIIIIILCFKAEKVQFTIMIISKRKSDTMDSEQKVRSFGKLKRSTNNFIKVNLNI